MKNLQMLQNNVKHFGFSSINEFAANQAKLLTMSKIEEYKNVVVYYEKKYNTNYVEFNQKLLERNNSEDFNESNDALEWRFASECLLMYQNELENL